MALDQVSQLNHVMAVNQSDATKGSAVGIAVRAGIEMDAEMPTPSWKLGFDANPDGAEFSGVSRTQLFDGAKAVAPHWQGRPRAGAMSIRLLAMGTTAHRIELVRLSSRRFKP